jgi:hypothetical protein
MGPAALRFFHSLARKNLTKNQGSGIITIPNRMTSESEASGMIQTIVDSGLPLEKFDQFIRSEDDILKYLNIIKNANKQRVIPADSPEGRQITEQLFGKRGEVVDMTGKKIDTRKGIMGGKSVEDLMESGQVTKGTVTKKSKKVTDREMFKAANERLTSDVDSIIKNIKSMEPITAMKEANSVIARKGKYKNLTPEQSKKILQDTEDHIFERDIPEEDFAKGGRAGFAGGSDMGTVSGATRSANTGLKGGYQNTGTGPVEKPGGGGGGSKPPPVTITVTKPNVKDKIRRVGNTVGDISYFKNLINLNPYGIAKNIGGKILMDKILGDQSSLDTGDEYDFSGIKGQMAGLNQPQVDYLNKVGNKVFNVDETGDFFNYDSPTNIKNKIEDLNSKSDSLGFTGFSFDPDKIVEGDKNTYATEKDVQDYIKSQFPTLSTDGRKIGLADGGRAGFFMGSRPAVQKGLSTLKEMLKYFGKKSDRVENPSDILKIVNPKRLNKLLEDPNIYRKFDVEKGIAAPDLIKNMQKQMMGDRQKTIEEMLGAAKNIKSADDNIIKYKNEMIEDMLKKGVDREMAEEMAETISKMAKGSVGKFDDTPKLTDEGVLQLENILKDMETGGKNPRELNATGGRIGYKDGPKMNRRTFMKYLAGFASLPIIGKIVKPLKTVKGVKNVPIIKTGDVPGKPEWFDALVNKVIIEGDDVTKKFATTEREVVHTKKIDADNEVTVYRDLDTDSVRVDYSSPDVMLDEPISLSYTRGQADEATQGMKPADEFETFEQGLAVRSNGPDDYSIDPEPSVGSSISSLETDVSKLKEYATGKKPTMKEFVASKKRKDRVRKINEGDIGETSDYVTKKQGDYYDYDDYASGGIARMLGE